jgi:Ca-activated chloride channel family protein
MNRLLLTTWAALVTAAVSAQPAGRVRITSPTAGGLVTGPVTLRADVTPATVAARVKRLSFFADGHEVCALEGPPFECEWDAGRDVLAHVIRVVAWLDDGSRLTQSIRTQGLGYVDKVNVDAVQITVVVTDSDGRFVQKLPREAFQVFEDDRPQTLTTFASDEVPLELVAALDVSQSMTDAMADLKRAARMFLASLAEREQVTLLAFNDNIVTLARKTTGREVKLRAVDRLAPWGGTALYDVIIRGIDTLGKQVGRRALVVFSDGEDQSSRSTMQAAVQRVESSDATIYAVGLGRATGRGPLHDLLDRLAALSGGRGLFASRSEELEPLFKAVFDDLSHQYLIGYQPTNQKRDGAWRRVKVTVRGDYKVRHRQGYRLMPEP